MIAFLFFLFIFFTLTIMFLLLGFLGRKINELVGIYFRSFLINVVLGFFTFYGIFSFFCSFLILFNTSIEVAYYLFWIGMSGLLLFYVINFRWREFRIIKFTEIFRWIFIAAILFVVYLARNEWKPPDSGILVDDANPIITSLTDLDNSLRLNSNGHFFEILLYLPLAFVYKLVLLMGLQVGVTGFLTYCVVPLMIFLLVAVVLSTINDLSVPINQLFKFCKNIFFATLLFLPFVTVDYLNFDNFSNIFLIVNFFLFVYILLQVKNGLNLRIVGFFLGSIVWFNAVLSNTGNLVSLILTALFIAFLFLWNSSYFTSLGPQYLLSALFATIPSISYWNVFLGIIALFGLIAVVVILYFAFFKGRAINYQAEMVFLRQRRSLLALGHTFVYGAALIVIFAFFVDLSSDYTKLWTNDLYDYIVVWKWTALFGLKWDNFSNGTANIIGEAVFLVIMFAMAIWANLRYIYFRSHPGSGGFYELMLITTIAFFWNPVTSSLFSFVLSSIHYELVNIFVYVLLLALLNERIDNYLRDKKSQRVVITTSRFY